MSGCGPECQVDPDCQYGYICSQQKCIEKPDPCQPSPCGQGALAQTRGDTCECTCPPGTIGDGYTGCQRGECQVDEDCHVSKACEDYYCVDPCLSGTCSATDFCRVMNHRPICGFNYEAPPQVARKIFDDTKIFVIVGGTGSIRHWAEVQSQAAASARQDSSHWWQTHSSTHFRSKVGELDLLNNQTIILLSGIHS